MPLDAPPSPAPPPAAPAAVPPRRVGEASVADREVVIQPTRGWIGVDWAELLAYRELFGFLVWRDIKVKYKQAILGAAWSVFVPLLSMAIYATFGMVTKLNADVPGLAPSHYPLYIFAGLIPWLFIQRAISDGGQALLNQQALMTKIYLPRLYLPASACGSAMVDMFIAFGLMAAMLVYYSMRSEQAYHPTWNLLALPFLLVLTMIAALGIAFLLSAAIVLYRDLRFIVPFITQFGLWLSGVVAPPSVLGKFEPYLAINPITGIVSGYRSAILGLPWNWTMLGSSIVICPLLLILGIFYFKRVERRFADIA